MAHINLAKRVNACLLQLRNKGDTDATVKQLLIDWKDEEAVQRAKHPERLISNIVGMGGSGLNHDANVDAMRQAIDIYSEEKHRRDVSRLESDIENLKGKLEDKDRQVGNLDLDYRRKVDEVDKLNATIHNLQQRMLPEGVREAVTAS